MPYIIGPLIFVIVKEKNSDRIIYMFGEMHFVTKNLCKANCNYAKCYEITNLLTDMFNTAQLNNKMINFIAEINNGIEELKREEYLTLYSIYQNFYNEFEGINKKYKNIYFNKVDIRSIGYYRLFRENNFLNHDFDETIESEDIDMINDFLDYIKILRDDNIYLQFIKIYIYSENFIQDINNLMKKYKNPYIELFFGINIEKIESFHQINHEGKNFSLTSFHMNQLKIKNESIFIKLEKFLDNIIKKANNRFLYYLDKAIASIDINVLEVYLLHAYDKLEPLVSIILDAKVLSNFLLNESNIFNYYIFYFGAKHIKRYYKFFAEIGFEILGFYREPAYKKLGKYKQNCLYIENDVIIEKVKNLES